MNYTKTKHEHVQLLHDVGDGSQDKITIVLREIIYYTFSLLEQQPYYHRDG
jgi:hypothetical protein